MTVLTAGEIGRLDAATEVLDADDFLILRDGVLFRASATVLAAYFVAVNTTTTDIAFGDSPYTVTTTDDFISVDASGGAVTVNLLPLATAPTKPIHVKKIDATGNAVTSIFCT